MDPKPKIVLLVDDDKFLLNMYALKFKNSGFVAETAESAESALQNCATVSLPRSSSATS